MEEQLGSCQDMERRALVYYIYTIICTIIYIIIVMYTWSDEHRYTI